MRNVTFPSRCQDNIARIKEIAFVSEGPNKGAVKTNAYKPLLKGHLNADGTLKPDSLTAASNAELERILSHIVHSTKQCIYVLSTGNTAVQRYNTLMSQTMQCQDIS